MIAIVVGLVLGATLGLGYCKLIGCASGACPLTSNPWIATVYGAVIGALVAASFSGGGSA